jgi:hypothetical protein
MYDIFMCETWCHPFVQLYTLIKIVYIYFKRQRVGGRVKRPERKGGKQGRK